MNYQTDVTKEQKKELNQKFQKKSKWLKTLLWVYVAVYIVLFILTLCYPAVKPASEIVFLLLLVHALIGHFGIRCPYCGNIGRSVKYGESCDKCFAILKEEVR